MRRLTFFLRFFLWFGGRHMRHHFGRALVVLFGIALGAAVFTSVRLSVYASLHSFTRSMDFFAGTAEKVLVRPGGYVPESVLAVLLSNPAVKDFSPLLTTYVRVYPPRAARFCSSVSTRSWTARSASGASGTAGKRPRSAGWT